MKLLQVDDDDAFNSTFKPFSSTNGDAVPNKENHTTDNHGNDDDSQRKNDTIVCVHVHICAQ